MVPVHTETWAHHFSKSSNKINFKKIKQQYETIRIAIPRGKLQNTIPWPPQLTPSKFRWEPRSLLVNTPRPTCSDALTPMLINGRVPVDSVRHLRAHLQLG